MTIDTQIIDDSELIKALRDRLIEIYEIEPRELDFLLKLAGNQPLINSTQSIPEGYALVPIEPSVEMLIASTNSKSPWNIIDAYKAMIETALKQSKQKEPA